MDFKTNQQQPVNNSGAQQPQGATHMQERASTSGAANKTVTMALAGVLVLVVVAAALWMALSPSGGQATAGLKTDKYQALFLTNGQVYFGKLSSVDGKYVTLKDIYYLQVQQSVQPAEKDKQPQVSLAKLGSELHGPEDEMHVSREQVLFWENLKNDGKVVKAIQENKNQ